MSNRIHVKTNNISKDQNQLLNLYLKQNAEPMKICDYISQMTKIKTTIFASGIAFCIIAIVGATIFIYGLMGESIFFSTSGFILILGAALGSWSLVKISWGK